MKRFATFAMLALMSGAAMSQSTATPATGTPPGSDKAPGTAASDVMPTRPVQAPSGGATSDHGAHGGTRQHDATKGTGTSKRGEASQSNRSDRRSASAAESYGYPASPAQAR
ncbi:hypothetical protein N6G06_22125 [Cupriavidus gilardii]|uniref:hypothetical protein n=1 Tax=Cupriavidus gilardii TaxID=82541 RepID=UPI0021BF86FA|nr:hypothetical protein [Cupriavidus gilardii]MCT9074061.1 hypothetical protein [Cupriavidus gilardii]